IRAVPVSTIEIVVTMLMTASYRRSLAYMLQPTSEAFVAATFFGEGYEIEADMGRRGRGRRVCGFCAGSGHAPAERRHASRRRHGSVPGHADDRAERRRAGRRETKGRRKIGRAH